MLRSQLWKNQKAAARESRSLRLEVAQLREENRLLQRRLEMALAQGAIDRATNGAGAEARAQMDDLDWNRERDLQRMAKLIAKVRRRLTLRGVVAVGRETDERGRSCGTSSRGRGRRWSRAKAARRGRGRTGKARWLERGSRQPERSIG